MENLGGAAGSIGRVAWAAPAYKGGNLATDIFNGAIYALGYDDFEAIIASDATPANSRRQLLAWLKSDSGKQTCGAGTR